MLKIQRVATVLAFLLTALTLQSFAQNTNTSAQTPATRPSSANSAATTPAPARKGTQEAQTPATETPAPRTRRAGASQTGKDPLTDGVLAAFDDLIEGIRRADVNAVTAVYWNSPQLILFNNNGTVTKGWAQMRKNRESSYPELKDVKIEIRDRRVQMLGRDGALLTCLWTQSQTFRGTPETASGRMTMVFRRMGTAWKAIHLHTSPDAPDPARVLPSEQTTTEPAAPAPKPTPKPRGTP